MSLLDSVKKYLPISKKTPAAEYFFALTIDYNKVTGIIWGIEEDQLHIINSASVEYKPSKDLKNDHESQQSLIDAANTSLDEALADFQPEPTKLLFSVPESWIQNDSLKSEYLRLLKKMVKELDVVPLAYVSNMHALCHFMQNQQGVPITAIIVEAREFLTVTVVKAGKVIASKMQKRVSSLAKDLENALFAFTDIEVLPPRILLYGDDDLEQSLDELSSFPWTDQLPFLHLPKISCLDSDIAVKATCFAGGSEINANISTDIIDERNASGDLAAGRISKDLEEADGLDESDETDENLGFVSGDILEKENKDIPVSANEDLEELADEDEDYSDHSTPLQKSRHIEEDDDDEKPASGDLKSKVLASLSVIPFFKNKSTDTAVGFYRGNLPFSFNLKILVFVIIFMAILSAGFVYLPKGDITVVLNTQVLDKQAVITVDPGINSVVVDNDNSKMPGQLVEVEITERDTGQATGKKQVGDPARGQVIIYNATQKVISLSKGTTLVTDKGLKFTLDESVQVASKSASAAAPPASSKPVKAVASDIGPEGNIAGTVELKVGNYSKMDVVARVDEAFTGGASREVVVVSAEDQKKLLDSLSEKIRNKAVAQLQEKASGDQKILEGSSNEQVISKDYSKQVNDQASDFTLNLTLRFKAVAYTDQDLKDLVSKLVESSVLEGYQLDLSTIEPKIEVTKADKDGKVQLNAKFQMKLVPKVDIEKIKKEIAGKTSQESKKIIEKIPNVVTAKIEMSPTLPGPFQRLPMRLENINVKVSSN